MPPFYRGVAKVGVAKVGVALAKVGVALSKVGVASAKVGVAFTQGQPLPLRLPPTRMATPHPKGYP